MAPLEVVPDPEKDRHPGADGLMLNLVHPNLYPIVYGRTMGKSGLDAATVLRPPEPEDVNPKFVSKRFQWLPSDFYVDDDGKVTLISPYINNVHPIRHKELYSVIPEILQHALPMFERVLSDLLRPLLPMRIATLAGSRKSKDGGTVDCIWKKGMPYPNPRSQDGVGEGSSAWYAKHKFNTPNAKKKYGGDLKVMDERICLKGRTLQVIVTMANIVLTPERPEYPGGNWHVEGWSQSRFVGMGWY